MSCAVQPTGRGRRGPDGRAILHEPPEGSRSRSYAARLSMSVPGRLQLHPLLASVAARSDAGAQGFARQSHQEDNLADTPQLHAVQMLDPVLLGRSLSVTRSGSDGGGPAHRGDPGAGAIPGRELLGDQAGYLGSGLDEVRRARYSPDAIPTRRRHGGRITMRGRRGTGDECGCRNRPRWDDLPARSSVSHVIGHGVTTAYTR